MADQPHSDPADDTVRLVRNVLALLVSSAIMVAVGVPIMNYDYQSGTAALAGTVALAVGLVAAAAIALRSLDRLERVAAAIVAAWRGTDTG